ncbi:Putative serine protease HtrA [Pirellulimonas nuda]|uniref:Serine protease HtrA n=1 Tax=Pirellulimonas nuda TaxID=2528009 RepID=A0A518D842_9BACT|nr:trypsin-like peptidase domain-containing protein [Pirellulimonas nuda]QDU87651.1 Putative serine protease HtrA [Pirellulimonas nuda]
MDHRLLAFATSLAITLGGGPALGQRAPLSADSERNQQFAQLARDVEAMERELGIVKRVVALVTPTVVHIEARPLREYRVRSNVQEAGSGVIVRFGVRDFVLTNRHVVKNSSEPYIRIQLADGRVLTPQRILSDPLTDVAVLEVEATDLIPARLGDSDAVEIGEFALAVGSPFGLSQSVTRGIISAKGRYNLDLGDGEVKYQNFLQTDAAINPGNSGGPLINLRGEVIGLNTAIASNSGGNEGIGFSIPINVVMRIARQLVDRGEVRWGFLGVTLDGLFDDKRARAIGLPRLVGARIKEVTPGSPAEWAQLRPDDVVISFAGTRIEDDDHLISLVKLTEVGQSVELVVFRDGAPMRTRVEIAAETGATN